MYVTRTHSESPVSYRNQQMLFFFFSSCHWQMHSLNTLGFPVFCCLIFICGRLNEISFFGLERFYWHLWFGVCFVDISLVVYYKAAQLQLQSSIAAQTRYKTGIPYSFLVACVAKELWIIQNKVWANESILDLSCYRLFSLIRELLTTFQKLCRVITASQYSSNYVCFLNTCELSSSWACCCCRTEFDMSEYITALEQQCIAVIPGAWKFSHKGSAPDTWSKLFPKLKRSSPWILLVIHLKPPVRSSSRISGTSFAS